MLEDHPLSQLPPHLEAISSFRYYSRKRHSVMTGINIKWVVNNNNNNNNNNN